MSDAVGDREEVGIELLNVLVIRKSGKRGESTVLNPTDFRVRVM